MAEIVLDPDPASTYGASKEYIAAWMAVYGDDVGNADDYIAPALLKIQPTNPLFRVPGMWVQTGLGPTGEDMTIWIEDGT